MPFIHDDSIVLPKLKQKNLPTGRVYEVLDGVSRGAVYPSITTILKAKPKPQLEAWKKRVGEATARREANVAAAKGSSLHKGMEYYLANREVPGMTLPVVELWRHLRPWLDSNVTRVYGQETYVFSDKLGVAGSFDLLCDLNDVLAVVDLKNAKRPKRLEYMQDYYLQGTFYAMAIYELTGKKVKRVMFPVVSPEGLQEFEIKPLEHFDRLLATIKDYYQKMNLDFAMAK